MGTKTLLRPVKCRKVCHFPNVLEFLPVDGTEKSTPIVGI